MDRLGDLRPVEQHVQFCLVSHGLSDDSKDVRNFTSPFRWKVPSTHLLLFLPEKNRSGHLVRTALREDLENLSSCTRKLTVPVLAWGRTGVFGQHRVRGRTLPTTSAAVRSSDADISLPKKNRSS